MNSINNMNISLLPHDVVFGRRGRKSLDGSHITKGTQELWKILWVQYKANGAVGLHERRIIAKSILTLVKQELPAGYARFVRLHQPKGSEIHSYRWMEENQVLEHISKMYYTMQTADRKKQEKMIASTAVAAPAAQDPVANAKSAIARMEKTCLRATRVFSTDMMGFPPLQDPSGITILAIEEEGEDQVGEE